MKGAFFLVLLAITFFCVLDAAPNGRKSQIRYINSMPQFGKAKLSALTPQLVVFDQVPQGFLTDYTNIDAQIWNFTTKYTTNMTATSDPTDLDSDSFATIFTCQTTSRKLKNKLIYDNSRSLQPQKALLRTINLAQFDYTIRVLNDSNVVFANVSYCSATAYKEVDPGEYDLEWVIADGLKRNIEQGRSGNGTGGHGIKGGRVYTFFVTPMGSVLVLDGRKKNNRSVRSELTSITAETAPQENAVAEDAEVNAENNKQNKSNKVSKMSEKRRRNIKASA